MTRNDLIRRALTPALMVFAVIPYHLWLSAASIARTARQEWGNFCWQLADNWRSGWETDQHRRNRVIREFAASWGQGKPGVRKEAADLNPQDKGETP